MSPIPNSNLNHEYVFPVTPEYDGLELTYSQLSGIVSFTVKLCAVAWYVFVTVIV